MWHLRTNWENNASNEHRRSILTSLEYTRSSDCMSPTRKNGIIERSLHSFTKSNPVVAQLTAVRVFWWSISRKLASVMVHGSLRLATRPQRFPRGRLVFSACLAERCGFTAVDSILVRGAVTRGKCHRWFIRGGRAAKTSSVITPLQRSLSAYVTSLEIAPHSLLFVQVFEHCTDLTRL